MFNIIVCMKQVLDPEMPLSLFDIDTEAKRAIQPRATPPVFSPFDENALEAALRIKDIQESNVTVISLGKKLTRAVVTSALAAGADNLFLLQDEAFDEFNTHLTAYAIAAAVKKIGQYHLILCGLQAADTNAGQVGTYIAYILGIPCITEAHKVTFDNDSIRVKRTAPDGYETIEAPTPAVVTTTGEVGVLRKPDIRAFVSAVKKPITTWNAEELGIETADTSRFTIVNMSIPTHEGSCEIVDGSSPEEKARNLATKLREINVI